MLDPQGADVPWSRVGWSARGSSTTRWLVARDGRFRLEDLPRAELSLSVLAPGFSHEPETCGPDQTEVELHLAPLGRLEGRVVDAASGAPVPEFVLALTPLGARPPRYEGRWRAGVAFSNPAGRWRADLGLAAGTAFALEVSAPGYVGARRPRVELARETSPEALVLGLFRDTVVRGRVLDAADGAPLARAAVCALRLDGQEDYEHEQATARTDENEIGRAHV